MRIESISLEPIRVHSGDGWTVEVHWPGGRPEVIGVFADQSAAEEWIREDALEWVRRTRKERVTSH